MVGSQIAVELSKLKLQGYPKMSTSSSAPPTCIDSAPSSSVLKAPPPSVHQAPPTIGGLREKQRGGSHSKQPVCAEGRDQFWYVQRGVTNSGMCRGGVTNFGMCRGAGSTISLALG